jgi:hypothetical protein
MTLTLENGGDTDFSGYLEYLLDPDSVQDVAQVPGLPGTNPGFRTSGWTANWIYDGPSTAIASPAQGLVWTGDEPSAVNAQGYIAGVWFPASVPAGGKRTITWYHVTDYPADGGDVTANVARWAQTLRSAATIAAPFSPTGLTAEPAPSSPPAEISDADQLEREWIEASNEMGFSDPATPPDAANRWVLNHAIWYATKGYDTPYPGEEEPLTPAEVSRTIPAGIEDLEEPEED